MSINNDEVIESLNSGKESTASDVTALAEPKRPALKTGKYAGLLPPATREEYAALKASIEKFGVREPVLTDEDGEVIDGRTRLKIAEELGINCPVRVEEGLTEEEKRHLALSLNMNRRRLSNPQKRAIVRAELLRNAGITDRWLAEICGVAHRTVGKVRKQLASGGVIATPAKRRGKDGKEQPARKAAKKPAKDAIAPNVTKAGVSKPALSLFNPEPVALLMAPKAEAMPDEDRGREVSIPGEPVDDARSEPVEDWGTGAAVTEEPAGILAPEPEDEYEDDETETPEFIAKCIIDDLKSLLPGVRQEVLRLIFEALAA